MKIFSGANFCFWVPVSVGFILVLFCICFSALLFFPFPKLSREISFLVRSVVWINFRVRTLVFRCRFCSAGSFSPFSKGEMLSVFFHFVFFASGSVSFVVFLPFLFSEGRCLKKFSGANFCFWVSVCVLRVLVLFCLSFCFIICFFAPETVLKKFS